MSDFNWSVLDRTHLAKFLWSLYPEVVDKSLSIAKLHSTLAKHIKKYLPIRISKKVDDPSIESGWVYIGGTYFSDWDQEYKKCIEINFNYCPSDKKITLSKSRFRRICYTFADVLLHEIIHMRQYRRRKFKIIPDYESTADRYEQQIEQSYLGCPDEIDAYGFNIACELLDKCGSVRAVSSYLGNKHHKGRLKSHSLKMYLKAFDYNHNHKIIKKVKAKAIRYLPNAELGRPYKTKDWINW